MLEPQASRNLFLGRMDCRWFEQNMCKNATAFLRFARNLGGDDPSVLELALEAWDSADSSASEHNLRKVLDCLEVPLLKTRQKLSLGLTVSLCMVALISYYHAIKTMVFTDHLRSNPWQLTIAKRELKSREQALRAIFNLVKSSDRDGYQHQIRQAVGADSDKGTVHLPYSMWLTC